MRRKDREVTDIDEIRKILDEFKVCRLGLVEDGKPYIVPMNMAYDLVPVDMENGLSCNKLSIYFHCAKEGRKIDIIRQNPEVGFEMDREIGLVKGNTPCQYSYRYVSMIGTGTATIVEDVQEKAWALKKIMKHQTGKEFHEFSENPDLLLAVSIIRVDAHEYTCKKNQ